MSHSKQLRIAAVIVVLAGICTLPAHAVNKDMVQLQTQIQQLQDAVARLQQSNDERMGVLKDLVQQTADSVNKMSITVNGLQLRMQNEQDAVGAKSDQLAGQIQSLNDSIDELKARMQRMEKALGDIQSQQQSTNAILGSLPGANPAGGTQPAPAGSQPNGLPGYQPVPQSPSGSAPVPQASSDQPAPVAPARPVRIAPAGAGGSAGDLYKIAYSDYMTGKNALAVSEFNDLIAAYPDDNLAGNAYFYIGEIDMRTQKPTAAVKSYDHVLEHYPDNNKIPAAHLHKAVALISMKQNDAAVRELRALIQRFPTSNEADIARTKLASLTSHR